MPSKKIQSNRRFNIVVDWGGGTQKQKTLFRQFAFLCGEITVYPLGAGHRRTTSSKTCRAHEFRTIMIRNLRRLPRVGNRDGHYHT